MMNIYQAGNSRRRKIVWHHWHQSRTYLQHRLYIDLVQSHLSKLCNVHLDNLYMYHQIYIDLLDMR